MHKDREAQEEDFLRLKDLLMLERQPHAARFGMSLQASKFACWLAYRGSRWPHVPILHQPAFDHSEAAAS